MTGEYYTMTGGMIINMTRGILRKIQTDGAGGVSTTIINNYVYV